MSEPTFETYAEEVAYKRGFVEGDVFAEKRIIKLLEGYTNAKCDEYCSYRCECFGKYEAQTFIALIEGENTIRLSDQDYEQLNDAIKGEN